jgi:hypothetical protein
VKAMTNDGFKAIVALVAVVLALDLGRFGRGT